MNKIELAETQTVEILCSMGGAQLLQRVSALYTNEALGIINNTNLKSAIRKTRNLEKQLLFVQSFYQQHNLPDDGLLQFASQGLRIYYQNLQEAQPLEVNSDMERLAEVQVNQLQPISSVRGISNRKIETGQIVRGDEEEKKERPNASVIAHEVAEKYHFAIFQNGIYLFCNGYYKAVEQSDIRRLLNEEYRSVAEKFGFAKFYDYVIDFIVCEQRLVVHNQAFETTTYLIAFQNGFLDTMTMKFFQPDYRLFLTSNVNLNYQPDTCSCLNFDSFLNQIAGGDELLVRRIWEVFGYILSNDLNAKAIFVCQGLTNSGKSTLIRFISSFFDEDLVTALSVDELDRNFTLKELIGKSLCVDTELTATPLKTACVGRLKQVSSKDLLTSDKKYCDRVKFICRAKIVLATNHRFQIDHRDDAFLKRIVTIPFYYEIPKNECNPEVLRLFEKEKLAIVQKAIYHYCQLRQNRYVFSGDFKLNAMFEEETVGVRQISCDDWIKQFLVDRCIFDKSQFETTENLYNSYENDCQSCQVVPVDRKKFTMIIKKIAGDKVEPQKLRVVSGESPKSVLYGIKLR